VREDGVDRLVWHLHLTPAIQLVTPLDTCSRSARWVRTRLLWIAVAIGPGACSAGDLNADESSAGAGNGAGAESPAIDDLTVVRYPGYGGGPGSAESTCDPTTRPDTLAFKGASRELSWDLCRVETAPVYTTQVGQRTLADGEIDSIRQTLDQLKVGTAVCLVDVGLMTLDVGAGASAEHYASCPPESMEDRTAASGISDVWTTLEDLSGHGVAPLPD
jgi:hypothetical protein